MDRAVAIKKLGRLLGKNLGYRVDPKAPKQDERDEAKVALEAAVAERNALKEKRDARYKAILAADEEYQRLFAEHRTANEHVDRLHGIMRHHKIVVGTTNGLFFRVEAEGDTWEEVIEIVTKSRQAAA